MKNNFLKKNKVSKRCFIVLFCFFLLSTSSATVLGNYERIELNNNLNCIESLSYKFTFVEPNLQEYKIKDSIFTKVTMPGSISLGIHAGEPSLLPFKFIFIMAGKDHGDVYVPKHPVRFVLRDDE